MGERVPLIRVPMDLVVAGVPFIPEVETDLEAEIARRQGEAKRVLREGRAVTRRQEAADRVVEQRNQPPQLPG